MTSTTGSLESLQQQINSLAGVVLQNRRALDLITAEHGGTCLVLGKESCFYVKESNVVKTNVNTLQKLHKDLLSRLQPFKHIRGSLTPCLPGSYPFPPLRVLHCILTMPPCLIQFWQQITTIAEIAFPRCPYGNQTSY